MLFDFEQAGRMRILNMIGNRFSINFIFAHILGHDKQKDMIFTSGGTGDACDDGNGIDDYCDNSPSDLERAALIREETPSTMR